MLIPVRKIMAEQAIEFNSKDYFNNYHGAIPIEKLVTIMKLFFFKLSAHILLGNRVSTPIGSFYLKRMYNHPNSKFVSYAATNKARRETGDDTVVVLRDPDKPWYRFVWAPSFIEGNFLYAYIFKASWKNNRLISEHHQILDLHVV